MCGYRHNLCGSCSAKERLKDPKNHSFYIDGRSFEKYPREFNRSIRKKILLRDRYVCQNCSIIEKEHFKIYNRQLHIHHIDYNKKNCKETNLITLCQGCNLRANKNREYWKEFYYDKIMLGS